VRALAPPLVAGGRCSRYLALPVCILPGFGRHTAGLLPGRWVGRNLAGKGLGGRVGTELVEVRSALNARLVESVQADGRPAAIY